MTNTPMGNAMKQQSQATPSRAQSESNQQYRHARKSLLGQSDKQGTRKNSPSTLDDSSSLAHELPDLESTKPVPPSSLLHSAYTWFVKKVLEQWKKSQSILVPRQSISFATENPSTFAVSVCILLSALSRSPIFLYGILYVLACHIFWVSLRWIEYMLDDPELRNFWNFVDGWSSLAVRQGQRILRHGKSEKQKR